MAGALAVNWLPMAPVLVPLTTALACALLASRPRAARGASLAGAFVLLACALALLLRVARDGTLRVALGSWAPPVGIELAVDALAAAMVLSAALLAVACLVFQRADADAAPETPTLHPLIHAVLAGACGALITADLFNLYVWFELMLIASLGLLALGGARRQLDATLKYFVLNVLGTLLFLAGIAAVYGLTGHLNFTALQAAGAATEPARLLPAVALVALAFLIKSGAFPLYAWLPASYHTLSAPVLALFAALLTKVGVIALLRLVGEVFALPQVAYEALGWIGAATMVAGVLGAAYHWDMRRILAVHIISQIGYMLLGIALHSPQAATGTLFFVVHNMVVKANLFLIAAMVWRLTGSYDLRRIGGLWRARPGLAVLFLLQALSLVGIPPLSGFWAKFIVLREALLQGQTVWAATGFAVGFLTLYSMAKIWLGAFWKPHPTAAWAPPADARLGAAWAASLGLAALSLTMGLFPEPLIRYATRATALMAGGG